MTSLIYECTLYLLSGQEGPVLQLYPQKIVINYPESWSQADEHLYFVEYPELRGVVDYHGKWDPDFVQAIAEPWDHISMERLAQ